MLDNLNIYIALVVFMGIVSGGMLSLVLMSNRKQQAAFSIMLGLAVLATLLGAFGMIVLSQSANHAFLSAAILLVLSLALGYTLTTFSVLLSRKRRPVAQPLDIPGGGGRAVICLAAGEPPEYDTESAAQRFDLADNAQDVPPLLLRPFYMRDLKGKYAAIGRSPYRDYQMELARKVQSRLEKGCRIYTAFYSDRPDLEDTIAQVLEDGAESLLLVHVRVSEPPDSQGLAERFDNLEVNAHGPRVAFAGPLWDSKLIPQIYVRRVLEAVPQEAIHATDVGLLLVGRGHPAGSEASVARHQQELHLQKGVRVALLKTGFDESRVVIGWLRQSPSVQQALMVLHDAGCKSVYWMPSSFVADGINTLFDIPVAVSHVAKQHGIKLVALGAWNADDLAAEEIASRVRATTPVPEGSGETTRRKLFLKR